MKKRGALTSKNGTNPFFFQKTESESWGLPLMNGGLEITDFCKRHRRSGPKLCLPKKSGLNYIHAHATHFVSLVCQTQIPHDKFLWFKYPLSSYSCYEHDISSKTPWSHMTWKMLLSSIPQDTRILFLESESYKEGACVLL